MVAEGIFLPECIAGPALCVVARILPHQHQHKAAGELRVLKNQLATIVSQVYIPLKRVHLWKLLV